MSIFIKKLKATSLLEVLLYVSLLAVVIPAVGMFVSDILSAKNKQHAILETETEVMFILEEIDGSLDNAIDVTLPAVGGNGGTLEFTIFEGGAIVTKQYSLQNGNVVLSENGQTAETFHSNRVFIQNLSFRHTSADLSEHIVLISFDIQYRNISGRNDLEYSRPVHTSITLRENNETN